MDGDLFEYSIFNSSTSSSSSYECSAEDDQSGMFNVLNRQAITIGSYLQDNSREVHRRQYIFRDRLEGHKKLIRDYFSDTPVYGDEFFHRWFRMHKPLFNRILEAVASHDDYFVRKRDAAGKVGFSPHQKITAALRLLCYDDVVDQVDEHLRMAETTVLVSMKRFCRSVVVVFGPQYLWYPTRDDITRLLEENTRRGFPGMLGSVDCMHWQWKNCPVAWHGSYKGHGGEATIVLEVVASYDLWIWHAFFGMPCSNNHINVLNRSNLFQNLLTSIAPPVIYTINGNTYDMGYYLAYGIYPPLATLVKTFKEPETEEKKHFSKMQEGARKDVERAFGVLQAKFGVIRGSARYWNKNVLTYIMKMCIILHNMIVEDERRNPAWGDNYEGPDEVDPIILGHDRVTQHRNYTQRSRGMRDKEIHHRLRRDLVAYLWERFGDGS